MTLCETLEEAQQLPPVRKEGITQLNKNLCYSGEKKTVSPFLAQHPLRSSHELSPAGRGGEGGGECFLQVHGPDRRGFAWARAFSFLFCVSPDKRARTEYAVEVHEVEMDPAGRVVRRTVISREVFHPTMGTSAEAGKMQKHHKH